MKVALVRGKWHSCWEALAVGYLKSFTEDLVAPEDYVFYDGWFDDDQEIVKGCAEADIVGFSGTTSQMPWSVRIADAIQERNPDCLVYLGGYGPSVDPGSFDGRVTGGVIVGEGERPWRDILLSGGNERGIIFRPAIPNLDSIPFPDRDFVKGERCSAVAKKEEGRKVCSVLGNRGCLRRCKFCADGSPKTIYGVPLRERSPLDILAEMRLVSLKYEPEFFKFADPEVNTRPGRIQELAQAMIDAKWDVPWGGNMLVNPFDETDARMLYEAGCREVWMGLESGNAEIQRHIGKGINLATIRRAFKAAKDAGLMRRAYVLMGTPLETKETIRETEALIDEVKPDTVSFSILAPYPGTEYYRPEFADWDWEKVDEYGGDVNQYHNLGLTKMTRPELLAERLRLIERYKRNLSSIMTKKIALGIIDTGEIQVN